MKIREMVVFVDSIKKASSGTGLIVEASNGGPIGHPFIRLKCKKTPAINVISVNDID